MLQFIIPDGSEDIIRSIAKTKKGRNSVSKMKMLLKPIDRISNLKIRRNEEYQRGVPMSAKILAKDFGNGTRVKEIFEELKVAKIIVQVSEYSTGREVRYRLHPQFEQSKFTHVNFDSPATTSLIDEVKSVAVTKKIISEKSRAIHDINSKENGKSRIDNVSKLQRKIMKKYLTLSVDGQNMLIDTHGYLPRIKKGVTVEGKAYRLAEILSKNFKVTRSIKGNRIYSPLTDLPRDQRQYVLLNGLPLLMTDIRNSQILLSAPLIENYWKKKSGKGALGIPKDVIEFKKLAEIGEFYEKMAEWVGVDFSVEDRGDFKKEIFHHLFFSKTNRFKKRTKTAFKKHFPNVYTAIVAIKKDDHKKFACKLQRIESGIMVDKVFKSMIKMGRIVLTLHDAIITNNIEDIKLANQLILEEMAKLNLKPTLKTEYC